MRLAQRHLRGARLGHRLGGLRSNGLRLGGLGRGLTSGFGLGIRHRHRHRLRPRPRRGRGLARGFSLGVRHRLILTDLAALDSRSMARRYPHRLRRRLLSVHPGLILGDRHLQGLRVGHRLRLRLRLRRGGVHAVHLSRHNRPEGCDRVDAVCCDRVNAVCNRLATPSVSELELPVALRVAPLVKHVRVDAVDDAEHLEAEDGGRRALVILTALPSAGRHPRQVGGQRQQGARRANLIHEREPVGLHGRGVEQVVVPARLAALLAQEVALRHPRRGAGPVGEVALRLDVAQVPEEGVDAELLRASCRELAFVRKEVARSPVIVGVADHHDDLRRAAAKRAGGHASGDRLLRGVPHVGPSWAERVALRRAFEG
mmetsp:Transcript_56875/g.136656  ORF Transcript_56875/g.136656 Transcript_56875/m.136656 type:complete len:372 (-) Transcript_56875:379-1494(-)